MAGSVIQRNNETYIFGGISNGGKINNIWINLNNVWTYLIVLRKEQ